MTKKTARKIEDGFTDTKESIDACLDDLEWRMDDAHQRGVFEEQKIAFNLEVRDARLRVIAFVRSREGSRAWIRRTDDEPISGDNVVRLRR